MANEAALKIKAALDPANAQLEEVRAKIISIQDANLSASAAAKEMSSATRAEMREAQHAVHLLGDEIGVKVPRHLRGVIASLPGFATALSAAFAPAAAFALLEILVKVVEKVSDLKDELQGYTKEIKEMMKEAVDASNRALTHFSNIPLGKLLIGQTEQQIAALEKAKADLEKQQQSAHLTGEITGTDPVSLAQTFLGGSVGLSVQINQIDKELTALNKRRIEQEEQFKDLEDKDHDDRRKHAEQLSKLYEKQAEARQAALAKIKEMLSPIIQEELSNEDKLRIKYMERDAAFKEMYDKGRIDLQEYISAQDVLWRGWFTEHQKMAEADAKALADIYRKDGLAKIAQILAIPSAEVKGPILEIKNIYHDTAQLITRDFKEDVVDALHAATMGAASFKDAMKQMALSIISDIAKIIEEMLVMQAVQAIVGFFIPKGGGLGRTINPLGGADLGMQIPTHASGGFFPANMPFIAGEEGPEMIFPSTSGRVAPNYAMRGNSQSGTTILVDARGADAGIEQRVMRAMQIMHDQTVARAVNVISERSRRRT